MVLEDPVAASQKTAAATINAVRQIETKRKDGLLGSPSFLAVGRDDRARTDDLCNVTAAL